MPFCIQLKKKKKRESDGDELLIFKNAVQKLLFYTKYNLQTESMTLNNINVQQKFSLRGWKWRTGKKNGVSEGFSGPHKFISFSK